MEIYEAQDYVLRKIKSLGAEDTLITASRSDAVQQKFVNNEIVMTKNWVDEGLVVFVAVGKRGEMQTGFTSVPFESKSKIDARLKKLLNFVKLTPPNKNYYSIAKGPFKYKKVPLIFDKKILNLETKDTNILVESISQALESGATRCSGNLEHSFGETRLVTSNNVDVSERSTDIKLSFRVFAGDSSAHRIAVARNLADFKPLDMVREATDVAKMARSLGTHQITAGKYDVLFDQLPFAVLVNQVGSSASMFNVETESSFFGGKLGKKVANPNLNLYDYGNLPGGISSAAFDDEGRPTRRTTVISKGVLKSYLHNTSTANRHNTKSTSNAGVLFPRPTNLVVSAGKISQRKLLSELKNGLYVTNLWYTRFQNYKTGDFSTLPRDTIFLVKNGEIVGTVGGIRISDNMINVFKNIKSLGDKKTVQKVEGWEAEIPSEVPSAIIKNLNITKPDQ